ncbi:MAG: hypothetical protein ACYDHX_06090 [Methanothrix sp.]
MAYELDYLITTDKTLRKYRIPDAFQLVVMHPKNVDEIFYNAKELFQKS